MEAYVGELIGTFLLLLLGNGVVANVILKDTKGYGAGWAVITIGWGLAVFVAVFGSKLYRLELIALNPYILLPLSTLVTVNSLYTLNGVMLISLGSSLFNMTVFSQV